MDFFDEPALNEPVLYKEIEVSFGIDGYRFYQGFRNEFDAGMSPVEICLTLIIVKGDEKILDSGIEGYVHLQNADQALEFVRLLSAERTWFLFPSPGIEISYFIREEGVLEDSRWEEIYRETVREYLSDGFTEEDALNDCLDLISSSKFEELKALGLFDIRVNALEDTPDTFLIERCVCSCDDKINRIRETVRSDGHYSHEVLQEIEIEGYKIQFPSYE